MLTQEGLVEHLPRRGTRVTAWSDTDIDELFGLRAVLERHAVVLAFPMSEDCRRDRLPQVRARLEELQQADIDGDHLRKDDAHGAFHAAVVSLAGNRQLDLAMEPILLKLQRPMALNLRREAQLAGAHEGIRRHERLLAVLESNDREAALLALEQHGA